MEEEEGEDVNNSGNDNVKHHSDKKKKWCRSKYCTDVAAIESDRTLYEQMKIFKLGHLCFQLSSFTVTMRNVEAEALA